MAANASKPTKYKCKYFLLAVDSFKKIPTTYAKDIATSISFVTLFTSGFSFFFYAFALCCPPQSKGITAFKWCPISKSHYMPWL